MLNARFLPMGIAAAPAFAASAQARRRGSGDGRRVVGARTRGGRGFDRELMLGATLPQYPAWVGGTLIGVLGGDALGDPAALGLDAIFPAFFLGLLAAELARPAGAAAAVLGGRWHWR